MHDEELAIFIPISISISISIGLWRCRDRATIETRNHLTGLGDAKGDEPVAQIA
jgi:hypothetical protein